MYSTLSTQVYAWTHYIISFILLFGLLPPLLFVPIKGDMVDRLQANFVRMVFYIVVVGYVLVVLKLYEVLGLTMFTVLYLALKRRSTTVAAYRPGVFVMAAFFDLLELPHITRRRLQQVGEGLRNAPTILMQGARKNVGIDSQSLLRLVRLCGIIVILGASCAIRLYDAIHVAAPPLSDGDVILAWIKYIDERILFHDGIYPQGMIIYMATIGKLAVINSLFVMKFSGAVDNCILVVSLYLFVKQMSKSEGAALISAAAYGLLGWMILGSDWTRLAASEVQEFGFIFAFPTAYFLSRYFLEGRRLDLWIAFFSLSDAGLVHTLSYELAFLAGVSVVLAAAILDWRRWSGQILWSLAAGVVSGLVALAPLGLGLLLHIPLNQSAVGYLASKTSSVAFPQLGPMDDTALVSMLILFGVTTWTYMNQRTHLSTLVIAIWGALCFILYEFGDYLTHSVVLSSRMLDLWALTASVLIGVGISEVFGWIQSVRMRNVVEIGSVLILVASIWIYARPTPIIPYTMQWNDDVNAYLEINQAFEYATGSYMIVAPNYEYALVLGYGYRMSPKEFLQMYDPSKPPLTRYGQHKPDPNIASHVFLYVYKRIFRVSRANGVYATQVPLYAAEQREGQLYKVWLSKFVKANGKNSLIVFYDSRNLIVYEITVQASPKKHPTPS